MRPLLNNGGILAVLRLAFVTPCTIAYSCGEDYWHRDARPWLSRSLLTLGHRLA